MTTLVINALATRGTRTIPIVFTFVTDPIGRGLLCYCRETR